MFMSPSHAMIYVSLLREALIPSHALTFNKGNRQGRAVSRVQFDTKSGAPNVNFGKISVRKTI